MLMHAVTLAVGVAIWRPLRSGPGPAPIETALGVALLTSNAWLAWVNLT